MISFEEFFEGVRSTVNDACEYQAANWAVVSPLLVELADLRQEVTVKLWKFWKRGGKLDSGRSIRPFIYKIVKNQARTMARAQTRQSFRTIKILHKQYDLERQRLGDPTSLVVPAWDDRIFPGPEYMEFREVINQKLSVEDREFLELLATCDYEEIAKKLGKTTVYVSNRGRRLLKRINRLLQDQGHQSLPQSFSAPPDGSEIPEPA